MPEPVLGAQLYTVREFTNNIRDVRETLRKVADIGYTAIQISGFGPMDTREVAQAVEEANLTVTATHTPWNRFLEELDVVIEEHKILNCTHTAIGGLPPEYFSLDGLQQFLDELPPVAEKLAAEGMDFSYHNHHHELARFGEGKTWLDMLYERADPRYLKAEIDTHWIVRGGGDPAQWIRKLGDRQPLLHLKDMAITPEREPIYAEVGEGNLNWPAILDAAKEVGVRWYLVEQDDCYGRDPFESLRISYENLKGMGLR